MDPLSDTGQAARRSSPFAADDVQGIAQRRGWLRQDANDREQTRQAWMSAAAELLGPQAEDLDQLESLLGRIFRYDARENLSRPENHAVMAREGARRVLRELAALVLDSSEVNSDRYKEIVTALKESTGTRGQELFHPVRLALAGCAGEGEFDRVILLLDRAAQLEWAVKVKGCRERILEFCGALD